MKKTNILMTSILALAGMALLSQSALATSVVVSYTDGDLFLGFRATGGTGSSSDYLVDIGQPSQFDHSLTLSLGNIFADLSATFGPTWYSRTDLLYAVVGGNITGGPNYTDAWNTLYATTLSATPWPCNFNQGDTSSLTDSMGNAYTNNNSTANSPLGIIQTAAGNNSYATFQPGGANSGAISFQTWNATIEGNVSQSLYLDKMLEGSNNPGNVLGSFVIVSNTNTSTANLVFTSSVPEPSTYAMLGLGCALLLMGAIRHNRQVA